MIPFLLTLASAQQVDAPIHTDLEWPAGEERRFHTSMAFRSPFVMTLLSVRNEERYAAELSITAVIRCTSEGLRRRATDIRCTIDDAGVRAIPMRNDVGRIQGVLEEWERSLEMSTMLFGIRENGRVERVRLENLPQNNPRERFIAGRLETYYTRAIAPLDLQLPEEPSPGWIHRSPRIAEIPFDSTGGSVRLAQTSAVEEGDWVVTGTGDGTVMAEGYGFSMATATSHVLNRDCKCILQATAQAQGRAQLESGALSYSLDSVVTRIASDATVDPLVSKDMSVP